MASNGDGTFETPYDNVADAVTASSNDDYIFIYEGDGTNAGHSVTQIALKDGQKLFGQGQAFNLLNRQVVAAANDPLVTHTSTTLITLGDGNHIRGFHFQSAGSVIDDGGVSPVNGLTFENNTIDASTGVLAAHIDLNNQPQGTIIIRNNFFYDETGGSIPIIDFDHEIGDDLDLSIIDNTFDGRGVVSNPIEDAMRIYLGTGTVAVALFRSMYRATLSMMSMKMPLKCRSIMILRLQLQLATIPLRIR